MAKIDLMVAALQDLQDRAQGLNEGFNYVILIQHENILVQTSSVDCKACVATILNQAMTTCLQEIEHAERS